MPKRPTMAEIKDGIQETLEERGGQHGEFSDNAMMAQSMKFIVRQDLRLWLILSPTARESIDNILQKIARLVSCGGTFEDSWRDIEGYARLVRNELAKEVQNEDKS